MTTRSRRKTAMVKILAGQALVMSLLAGTPGATTADDTDKPASRATYQLPETAGTWTRDPNPAGRELSWNEARKFLAKMNEKGFGGCVRWSLPSRDDLTAMARHLADGGSEDEGISPEADFYWSSTTSSFEPDYADAVNMEDGSVDSQRKSEFNYLWPLCEGR